MADQTKRPEELTPEQKESKRILGRVTQDSETVGLSSTKRVADNVAQHFKGGDVDQNKWAELWGTRIGRFLGVIAFIALTVYLIITYVVPA